jgi:hypothetical protein
MAIPSRIAKKKPMIIRSFIRTPPVLTIEVKRLLEDKKVSIMERSEDYFLSHKK